MAEESVEIDRLEEEQFGKLIDWGLQTQLTWSVIFLTCFVGLIELLPLIPNFSPSSSRPQTVYLALLGSVYVFLVGGLAYSIYRTKEIIRWNFEWAKRTPNANLSMWLRDTRGILIKTLFSKHEKLIVSVAIGTVIVVWIAIFMLRVFFVV